MILSSPGDDFEERASFIRKGGYSDETVGG